MPETKSSPKYSDEAKALFRKLTNMIGREGDWLDGDEAAVKAIQKALDKSYDKGVDDGASNPYC
jgi:hypothetical protein